MKYYIGSAINLLFGIVVGFTLELFVENTFASVAGGLFVFLISEVIALKVLVSKHSEQVERMNLWLDLIKPSDRMSELAFAYGLKPTTFLMRNTVRVPPDQVWPFWRDCILKAETRWWVISYARPDTWWVLGPVKPTVATQEERVKWGCDMERIFCVDSDQEVEQLKQTFLEQKEVGVKVGFVNKAKLLENSLIAEYIRQLGTLDIAIVDDGYVYRTHLDKERVPVGGSLTKDRSLFEKASYVINQARAIAEREI